MNPQESAKAIEAESRYEPSSYQATKQGHFRCHLDLEAGEKHLMKFRISVAAEEAPGLWKAEEMFKGQRMM